MAKLVRDPKCYAYVGPLPHKRVGPLLFRKDQPQPVFDMKTDRLIARLPYFKMVGDAKVMVNDTVIVGHAGEAVPAKVEANATDAPDVPSAENEHGIPADWRSEHHNKRKKWAREISGQEPRSLEEADEFIAIYMMEHDK